MTFELSILTASSGNYLLLKHDEKLDNQFRISESKPEYSGPFFSPVLGAEVFNTINNRINTNSFDYFPLNIRIITSMNDIISVPLTVLFNMCIS